MAQKMGCRPHIPATSLNPFTHWGQFPQHRVGALDLSVSEAFPCLLFALCGSSSASTYKQALFDGQLLREAWPAGRMHENLPR